MRAKMKNLSGFCRRSLTVRCVENTFRWSVFLRLGVPKISVFYGVHANGRPKDLKRLPLPPPFWDWSMTGGVFGGENKYSRCQEKRHQNSWWRDHGGVVCKRPKAQICPQIRTISAYIRNIAVEWLALLRRIAKSRIRFEGQGETNYHVSLRSLHKALVSLCLGRFFLHPSEMQHSHWTLHSTPHTTPVCEVVEQLLNAINCSS
jgi:hypothetical protein